MNIETNNQKYRRDIDGLRAVAVLAVVIFHAFPSTLPGGYVGVDIFFVVSGYLITTIIYQGLRDRTFSFKDFYSRRIRRIFPSLTVVLISCLIFGWFSLVANEYAHLGKHVASSAGFFSNLLLWSESGYFDTASTTKPLLHLWSLGVEEQFYIVWPVLIWFLFRSNTSQKYIFFALTFASFGINLYDIHANSAAAYYSPLGRFWELLTGGLLAQRQFFKGASLSWPNANFRAAAGLFAIALSIAILNKSSAFPGWWALIPVIGTVLVLEAGQQAWVNKNILSNRVMVQVGLISYPLYLWHWPILSFADIIGGEAIRAEHKVAAIVLAVTLAWLTYSVIEKTFRKRVFQFRQVIYLVILMLLVGFIGFNVFSREGLPFRHEQLSYSVESASKAAAFTTLGVSRKKNENKYSCDELIKKKIEKIDSFCHLTSNTPHVAVIGDSHANHLLWGLQDSKNVKVSQALVIGAGGCHPTLLGGQSEGCESQGTANMKAIESFSTIKYAVLSANASFIQTSTPSMQNELRDGYLAAISRLQERGITVIFIKDTPEFLESPLLCARNPLPIRNHFMEASQRCTEVTIKNTKPREIYDNFLATIKAQNDSVIIFDAHSFFCNDNSCKVIADEVLVFKDTNHLTDYGSTLLVNELGKLIQ